MDILFVDILQMKIREIPVLDKLRYLYSLLSSVQPVIKQIHNEQCSEVELEKMILGEILAFFVAYWFTKFQVSMSCEHLRFFAGDEVNLARAKLNEDEQMCWFVVSPYALYIL